MPIISECTYQDFELLLEEEVVKDLSSIGRANECEFELPVFAYLADTGNTYKNDSSYFLLSLTNRYSTPEFYLEVQNGCNWDEVAQLTDSTYGEYYTFTSKPKWAGYRIDWHLVYTLEGVNCYRVRQESTNITDATIEIDYSYKYNLRAYTDGLADKTTKINYTINGGKRGSTVNNKKVINYKDVVWNREIRLPQSFFGFESSEFTRESTKYKTGAVVWTKDEQVETIGFNARRIPYSLHRELKITMLQADEIYISDYNEGNPNPDKYDHLRVKGSSSYEPTWNSYTTYAPIQLTFEPYYQNLEAKRC
jgi:hypothetical protein